MALPRRLWLPEGAFELNPATFEKSFAVDASAGPGPTTGQRLRRRALWRGEAGLLDRPVLVEWFPIADLGRERQLGDRLSSLCHVHVLRLLEVGTADARNAYAISEAPDGVDLLTVLRATPGGLPSWWGVAVAQAVARALCALQEHQEHGRQRAHGHGRVNLSTIFVGWDGGVRLLAFSPLANASISAGGLPFFRPEDLLAPELRLSERLSTVAADVYALGALLRQLLPQTALRHEGLTRLLRRCLHRQADQRIHLPALITSFEELLFDLQAPLGRAEAIGEVLGQSCPRATVDRQDTDLGEKASETYPVLPPTLTPLSPRVLAAVPNWLRPIPSPRRSWRGLWLWTGLGLLGGLLMFEFFSLWTEHRQEAPLATAGTEAAMFESPIEPTAAPLQELPLRPDRAYLSWQGLRLCIDQVERQPDRIVLRLRLKNPSARTIAPQLTTLRLFGEIVSEPGISAASPPAITIGAGRMQQVRLDFLLTAPRDFPADRLRLRSFPLHDFSDMPK